MKVLFQIRKDFNYNIAGDTIVLKNLREKLINLGVEVDIHTDTRIDLSKYHIVHIFNIMRVQESFKFTEHAKACSKKIVLTPIFWDMTSHYQYNNLTYKLEEWSRSNKKRQRILDNCDIFLPHCKTDEENIIKNFGNAHKSIIIPYGVKKDLFTGNIDKNPYSLRDFALCVGRIGDQKNQFNLIKSLLKENITLVLTGQVNDNDYFKKCLGLGYPKLVFIEKLKPMELKALYKEARVHVLPSWYEYPGLVNLEAGLAGCNVVTTEIGTTREVFKDFVRYCNPSSTTSIHAATMKAFESEKKNDFKEYILENYTWERVAYKLKEVYESL